MEKELKICIYAICKNESKFIDRWISSLKESDYIVVLDTGSTDNTVELLQHYASNSDGPKVMVYQEEIKPWRFDSARNRCMELIPEDADICVTSDCDQIFRAGWGDALRELYSQGFDEVYGDIIDYDDNNKEIKRFLSKNVHPNDKDWYWERPIHEGLHYHGDKELKTTFSEKFTIEHHPDRTKSRGNYLTLLEREYKENSNDPLCAIYYGCELCFNNKNDEGLEVFLNAVLTCDLSDCPEIGYQLNLNIADEYKIRKEYNLALMYIKKSESFGIKTRRLYMAFSDVYYACGLYDDAEKYVFKALSVYENARSWIETDYYFNGGCYVSLSLIYYNLKRYNEAIAFCALAEKYLDDNLVIKHNMKCFIDAYHESLQGD